MKRLLKLIILIIILSFLAGILYFFKTIQNKNFNNSGAIESKSANLEEKEITKADKETDEMMTKIKKMFSAQSINDLKEEEISYKKRYLDIFGLTPLGEQLDMLRKTSDCYLDDDLKNEFIAKKFKLFYGKGGPMHVDILRNDNLGKCALRLIGSDGFDVSLDNFNYILTFIDGENIYSFRKPFYKAHTFDFVDSKLKEIGYEFLENGSVSCDNFCGKNTTNLFNQLSKNLLNDPVVTKVYKIYDEMFLNL